MLKHLFSKLQVFFAQRKIKSTALQTTLATCLLTSLILISTGLLLYPLTSQFLWFGLSTALASFNFYSLILTVQKLTATGWNGSNLFKLLLHSNLKLILSGILLFLALTQTNANVIAILAGLTLPLGIIITINLQFPLKRD